jgi:hypothetical protein
MAQYFDDRKATTTAEHQLLCLSSDFIQPEWVVDSSGLSVDEVYARHFAQIVNGAGTNE